MAQPANSCLLYHRKAGRSLPQSRIVVNGTGLTTNALFGGTLDTFFQNISGPPYGPPARADGTLRRSLSKSPTLRALADEVIQ
jgi:hypothetical protein